MPIALGLLLLHASRLYLLLDFADHLPVRLAQLAAQPVAAVRHREPGLGYLQEHVLLVLDVLDLGADVGLPQRPQHLQVLPPLLQVLCLLLRVVLASLLSDYLVDHRSQAHSHHHCRAEACAGHHDGGTRDVLLLALVVQVLEVQALPQNAQQADQAQGFPDIVQLQPVGTYNRSVDQQR